MQSACLDHCNDHGPQGKMGHKGTDQSKPFERLGRYGECLGMSSECVAYGHLNPMQVILQLCIDDGIKSRGHQKTIFNKNMRKFACFKGQHKVHGKMIVCCYAESYSASEANLKPRLQAML